MTLEEAYNNILLKEEKVESKGKHDHSAKELVDLMLEVHGRQDGVWRTLGTLQSIIDDAISFQGNPHYNLQDNINSNFEYVLKQKNTSPKVNS